MKNWLAASIVATLGLSYGVPALSEEIRFLVNERNAERFVNEGLKRLHELLLPAEEKRFAKTEIHELHDPRNDALRAKIYKMGAKGSLHGIRDRA